MICKLSFQEFAKLSVYIRKSGNQGQTKTRWAGSAAPMVDTRLKMVTLADTTTYKD